MKKTYQKPLLEKRGKLSAITANGAGSQQIQYLDPTTAAYEPYGGGVNGMIAGVGGEDQYGGTPTDPTQLLYQPEQEKIFSAEPWQVVDTSLGAEGDNDWVYGDLQTPTAVLPPPAAGK